MIVLELQSLQAILEEGDIGEILQNLPPDISGERILELISIEIKLRKDRKAFALLYRKPVDEDIGISSTFLYDWTKDKADFLNKDALSFTCLRLHTLCYSANTSQKLQYKFYSELETNFFELLKAYKNKVRISYYAR